MKNTSPARTIGTFFAATAVILGAFGAHGLKDILTEHNSEGTWEAAVRYQMWHALGLILISIIQNQTPALRFSAYSFIAGTVLFSGSLYGLALGGPKWLGPITPLGGLCLIIGWGIFATLSFKQKHEV